MKKTLLLLLITLSSTLLINAQQRYSGQWIGKVSGGINITNKGGFGELGIEKIIGGSQSSIQASILYMYNTKSTNIDIPDLKIQNIYGLVDYTYTLFGQSPVRLGVHGGVFVGGQTVEHTRVMGVEVKAKGGFAWGVSAGVQVDFVLSSSLSLYVQPRAMYNMKSDLEDFSFITGVGMKFYF